jgi:hypothetical protein
VPRQVAPRDDLGKVKAFLKVLNAKLGGLLGKHNGCACKCYVTRLEAIELVGTGMLDLGFGVASEEL